LKHIINFFFELGMLKKTPRSGFQFLGSGSESVAEHVFRVATIGFTMARLDKQADAFTVVRMCLFHDIPESRTGDMNYVNKHYVDVREDQVVKDLAKTLPFGDEIQGLLEEFAKGESREAQLARDADQLDLILELICQGLDPFCPETVEDGPGQAVGSADFGDRFHSLVVRGPGSLVDRGIVQSA
jgi:putative hydrolase of HD superfamily